MANRRRIRRHPAKKKPLSRTRPLPQHPRPCQESWPQVQQLHTLIDRRHKTTSTIYCTQLPPGQWHDRMEEKILADAIVDRITTNAHATVLDCDDSMRKHVTHLE